MEQGLVAWVRSKRQGTTLCRPRAIRMLRADGSVDLVNDPWILANMTWYASELAGSLRKVAHFSVSFAEQTVYDGQNWMSLDIRGLVEKREAWLELKWTRGDLRSALALTKQRVADFRDIAMEDKTVFLDRHLGGRPLPQPHFIGGLAVSPDGWLLELVDLSKCSKERWTGFFESSPPRAAPSKPIVRHGPVGKRRTSEARSAAYLLKHGRYNRSVKGLARSRLRESKPVRKTYQKQYAQTANGREARAQARKRYKAKQRLLKRPASQ